MRGYETLAGRLPDTPMPALPAPIPGGSSTTCATLLAAAGLDELVTHGLIGPEDHARLGYRGR